MQLIDDFQELQKQSFILSAVRAQLAISTLRSSYHPGAKCARPYLRNGGGELSLSQSAKKKMRTKGQKIWDIWQTWTVLWIGLAGLTFLLTRWFWLNEFWLLTIEPRTTPMLREYYTTNYRIVRMLQCSTESEVLTPQAPNDCWNGSPYFNTYHLFLMHPNPTHPSQSHHQHLRRLTNTLHPRSFFINNTPLNQLLEICISGHFIQKDRV